MRNISGYLVKSFSGLFFSIFMPIIAIGSLILFVRIAKITEVTQMSFSEMLLMYSYFLPTILFYTLPITFFAALTLTMVKLSNDFENIILFTFGISPHRLLRFFGPLTFMTVALLLLLSLALIPITKQLTKSFISYKSVHAVLNIEPSQFGQKFGDWLVFLESKDEEGGLHNIVLYNASDPREEQVLIAREGSFVNENGVMGLQLKNGEAYRIRHDVIDQINFKTMKIYDTSVHKPFTYHNLIEYWLMAFTDKKRRKDFIIFVAVSLFPLLTIFYALSYGVIHPRYDKNYSYLAILAVTTIYYGVISSVAKTSPTASIAFLALFLAAGASLFYLKVQKRF
ncbi:LptF/LptG family permease [Hydrogenimonas urashimensis]|uniref:LptF/LptG family permease n=1 Tax=Hydrogenimonas urashimensis TaxID=2740515 RepID=UPI00191545D0|nr:LptF/LptG family permease [Hydrogenimonas urashimensis]